MKLRLMQAIASCLNSGDIENAKKHLISLMEFEQEQNAAEKALLEIEIHRLRQC